ncbi:MAG: VOC family protein [Pseudomonadota bacterium]
MNVKAQLQNGQGWQRRQLLGVLLGTVMGALAPVTKAQTPPAVTGIDHVEFFVTDLERSLTFYRHLFGQEVWKNRQTERRYMPLGSAFMALEQRDAARVDHVCFGIKDFDIARLHQYLDEQALAWQDYPSGNDLRVDDRNGTRVQLARDEAWDSLTRDTASLETRPAGPEPLFHPLAIDEVYITVANLEVDSLHYARLIGKTGLLQAGSLWFDLGGSRLRLSQAPVGQKPGVNYFSVLVSTTDLEAAAEAVFAAGGIIENILPNGFSFWDPDGMRVEVHMAGQF